MRSPWLLLVIACGSAPPPAEKPVEKPKPPAYTCATAADALVKPMALDADKKAMARHGLEDTCTQTHWPDAYVACASTGAPPCDDTRTPEQLSAAQHVLVMVSIPTPCLAYMHAIEALSKCDKMPPESREAMKQGLDAMRDGWDFTSMPAEAIQQAAEACKQGADAIVQGAKATGC